MLYCDWLKSKCAFHVCGARSCAYIRFRGRLGVITVFGFGFAMGGGEKGIVGIGDYSLKELLVEGGPRGGEYSKVGGFSASN